ncbi:hypothetical protein KR084_000283, partial [Drosophila pseudotakahashii]
VCRNTLLQTSNFTTIFSGSSSVQSHCQLDNSYRETHYVFAQFVNSRYEVLPADRFETNQEIHLLCGGSPPVAISTTCQLDGTFNPPLPNTDCRDELELDLFEDRNHPTCDFTLYKVGFWFLHTFMELYRSCYDATTMTADFSIHKVYSSFMKRERSKTWQLDGLNTGAEEVLYKMDQIYARFNFIFGRRQDYIHTSRSTTFDRGHLAPSADYTFSKFERATFKYLNAVPQHSKSNRGNWKDIEIWVREQHADVANVCTGRLGVLELRHPLTRRPTEMYLGVRPMLPVPEWVYKIVSFPSGNRIVILMSNNGWERQSLDPSSVCTPISCPEGIKTIANTFCCEPDSFIDTNVPKLSRVCSSQNL